jgi:type IV pilus assembly protein PilQ
VEDVLALLARAAGLNLAYVADAPSGDAAAEGGGRRTISLDVENESVQEVFNNVLRLSGLEANLMGNTVVVGNSLPDEARNIITRTIRLNQTEVGTARDFLLSYGAESALITTQLQSQTLREGQQGDPGATSVTTTTSRTRIESLGLDVKNDEGQSSYAGFAALPLRGLLVSIAPRGTGINEVANEISLTGDPRKVEIATQLISQLETRRRQVAVNVKIVDVSLSNQDEYNASFSFGVGDTFVTSDGGAGIVNFGGANPPSNAATRSSLLTPTIINNPYAGSQVFLDPNGVITVPGTSPGTVVIDENGNITGNIARGSGTFFRSSGVGISDNPLDSGIVDINPATDNIITRTQVPIFEDIIGTDNEGNQTVIGQRFVGFGVESSTELGEPGSIISSVTDLFQFPTRFLSTLQAQVINGNAKILTDPTLVIQEGQTSVVKLTSEVVGEVNVSFNDTISGTRESREVIKEDVGLELAVTVNRVDDNGFVTLVANPSVSAPIGQENTDNDGGFVTLIQQRSVESGQIRMRDGQTLILSGIIQDSDRTTVTKVPILGDIPILGALFRSTNRSNERQEVIVLLTPNILDDSDYNTFGYGYTPSREARDILEQQGNFQYPGN